MTMQLKKILIFTASIFIILIVVSGCSNNQTLDLNNATVNLTNDEGRLGSIGITSGERAGENVVPIALSYDLSVKNTGKKEIGGMEKANKEKFKYDDGIEIHFEPNETLKEVVEEVMGFNIYNEDENKLGTGKTGYPVLEPNQEGDYTFDFILGALEENPDLALAPSMEQIEKLEKHAMDVILIISVEDEELARFDLSDLE